MYARTFEVSRRSSSGALPMGRRRQIDLLAVLLLATCLVFPVPCQSSPSKMTLISTLQASLNATLLSPGGVFELGFYAGMRSKSASTVYTLAIWYAQTSPVKTVVWMADRSMNLSSNATLTLSEQGELQVYDGNLAPQLMWTSNTTKLNVSQAVMLDTGNLVLLNRSNSIVWQSFDSPTDTLLPGQPFVAAANITMFAWQKRGDWTKSLYSLNWTSDYNLNASWQSPYPGWSNSVGPSYWSFSTPSLSADLTSEGVFQATNATGNVTVIGTSSDVGLKSRLRRVTFDYDGNLRMYSWFVGNSTEWSIVWEAMTDICTVYGECGPFAICIAGGQCECPTGFQFVDANDTTQGCTRIKGISLCSAVDQTMTLVESVDYPNGGDYNYYGNVDLSTCIDLCLSSCFCQACTVTTPNSNGNYSCWHKKDFLLDGQYNDARTTYIRIAQTHHGLSSSQKLAILGATLGATIVFLGVSLCIVGSFIVRREIRTRRIRKLEEKWKESRGTIVKFTYEEIRLATRNFAEEIGKGGSGSVFKGEIGDQVVVAVKRLDKLSPEETEFVNEVDTIGRIHHGNLVDLHGYCAAGDHRLLVYEYMERGSLDRALFRANKNNVPILEWRSRFKIAVETAKGLAYLHEDVRGQRIIHCDVKPENILLDSMLSAKVADFGLARIMNKDQTRTMTMHIRGTCGYLAPEWTSDHMSITTKTDVYSYGMVLLEIISGRKNLKFNLDIDANAAPDWYYPLWAFSKVEKGAFLEVVDPLLCGIVNAKEVERAVLVAFWCINDKPHLRPSMAKVVQFLEGHIPVELPVPRPDFLDDMVVATENLDSTSLKLSSSSSEASVAFF